MPLIKQLLSYGRAQVPPLEARLLLEHVLGVGHAYLIAHDDVAVGEEATAVYHTLVGRAAHGEPIPYLIGRAPFYGRDFAVSPAVLIPRPETELLVSRALGWLNGRTAPQTVVDVGTGSGCIALTVALECPTAQVTAVDVSPAALAVAQANGARLGAAVHWLASDLLTAVAGPVDLLLANLPYITDGEWTHLDDGVKSYEPVLALRGGADGLALIRPLLQQATQRIRPTGHILLEIGWRQGAETCALARTLFPHAAVTLYHDDAGHDRVVEIAL